jgi:hypothetical protein
MLSPSIAHHRARIGALSRDRQPDDPELLDAKAALAAAKLDAYIDKIVAEAPPLTPEQRNKLTELLRPVRRRNRATS